jgi:hypothetical protein
MVKGFRTGDIVKAIVPSGKKAGAYAGKVAIRTSGSFNVSTTTGVVEGISHKYCSSGSQGRWVFVPIKRNMRSSRQ